jgi:hypothetical protein
MEEVWVFVADGSRFPSGIFTSKPYAEDSIQKHRLTGVLTCYPVGRLAYDWAVDNGFFVPKNDLQKTSAFVGKFTSAAQKHFHYHDGQLEG